MSTIQVLQTITLSVHLRCNFDYQDKLHVIRGSCHSVPFQPSASAPLQHRSLKAPFPSQIPRRRIRGRRICNLVIRLHLEQYNHDACFARPSQQWWTQLSAFFKPALVSADSSSTAEGSQDRLSPLYLLESRRCHLPCKPSEKEDC